MAKFEIKKSSTQPRLAVQLVDSTGSGIDLTLGSYIYFQMSKNDNAYTPLFSGLATVTGSTTGNIEYRWSSADTNRSGLFLGEFKTVFNDTSVLILPSDHSLNIKIYEDYGSW